MLKSFNAAGTKVFNTTGKTIDIVDDLVTTAAIHSRELRIATYIESQARIAVLEEQLMAIAPERLASSNKLLQNPPF